MTAYAHKDQTGSAILAAVTGIAVIAIVCLGTMASLVTSRSLEVVNEEQARGTAIARATMEDVMAAPFGDVFALFNEDPNDDPEGPGTAPGPIFALSESGTQSQLPGTAGGDEEQGMFARVTFPTMTNGSLSETAPPLFTGAPSDFNADGKLTTGPLVGEYKALPVLVEVTWEGVNGTSSVTIPRVLTSQSWQKKSHGSGVPIR